MTPQQRIEQTRRALQMEVLGRVPETEVVPSTAEVDDESYMDRPGARAAQRFVDDREGDRDVRAPRRSERNVMRDSTVERAALREVRQMRDTARDDRRRPSKLLDRAQRLQRDNRWLWDTAASVAEAWWVRQPAYTAVRLAEPALASVARRNPWRLLGIAALVGAGVAVLRPWRVAAVSSVLAASVRTPSANDLVGSVTSFMRSMDGRLRD